jgi:hypothetical protein
MPTLLAALGEAQPPEPVTISTGTLLVVLIVGAVIYIAHKYKSLAIPMATGAAVLAALAVFVVK